MRVYEKILSIIVVLFLGIPTFAQPARTTPAFAKRVGNTGVLWHDRGDVTTLDLLDGPGGIKHRPGRRFKFVKETHKGTSPKFDVEDENGVKWKVKLGREVKAETAASRLVWAVGYFVDEDYYRPQICVQGMKPLSRGQEFVSEDGCVREARLERLEGGSKSKNWSWYDNRFVGTREFNGLRVMMVLINNWDLKENNNRLDEADGIEQRYMVSDLGSSLGRTGDSFTRSCGVMKDYEKSKFIDKVTPEYVNFVMHSRPFFLSIFDLPYYLSRSRMEKVAKHIPVEDARWVGNRLGQLSPEQIGDCFRTAGFSQTAVEGYTKVVMERIEALKNL